jgi:hypothetical protein
MFSLAMAAWASAKFSSEPLALKLVMGVPSPVVEAPGVDFEEADFLAALSARRLAFDAETGGMLLSFLGGRVGGGYTGGLACVCR